MHVERDWTTAAGLRAVVVLNDRPYATWRCGYVAVPKGHPLFGATYRTELDCLKAAMEAAAEQPVGKRGIMELFLAGMCGGYSPTPCDVFNVHGSITYSGENNKGDFPVTHDRTELHWFGFDCNHYDDNPHKCDETYVANECESLASQMASVGQLETSAQGT